MDCKDFQDLIPLFLENKINKRQAQSFFEHMNECDECKEEVRIQYLISEGMLRLEEGKGFDLNKELDKKIEDTQKAIKSRTIANSIIYSLEVVAILAVLFILFLVFFRN